VLLTCCFLAGCITTPPPPIPVTQVILLWLKNPERQANRAQIRRTARSLRMIPGVRSVQTRRSVPGLPPGADRNFDLAVIITFADRVALQRYRNDPRHRQAFQSYLRPLVRHYEVYNLSGDQE
jgi:stress responsive alpha/beta barrel protein